MAEQYDILLESPLGERSGALCWTERNGAVEGTLTLLGFENSVTGQREGRILTLTHPLRTVLSTLHCETRAELLGDALAGTVCFRRSQFRLRGKRSKEGEKP